MSIFGKKIKFLYSTSDSTGINSLSMASTTDMVTIVKHGKVIGIGASGNRQANCSEWVKVADTIICYAPSNYNSVNLFLYTSTNGGFNFTDNGSMINISLIPGAQSWGYIGLLKDTAGAPVQINGKYQLFIEASNPEDLASIRSIDIAAKTVHCGKASFRDRRDVASEWDPVAFISSRSFSRCLRPADWV